MGEGSAAYSSAELLCVFWPFFSPYRWRIAGAALALLMVAGALLTMGRGLAYLVDEGLGRQDPELLNGAVIGTAVIAFVLAAGTPQHIVPDRLAALIKRACTPRHLRGKFALRQRLVARKRRAP